ncbi:hypothetical protein [Bacillus spizizenii]
MNMAKDGDTIKSCICVSKKEQIEEVTLNSAQLSFIKLKTGMD